MTYLNVGVAYSTNSYTSEGRDETIAAALRMQERTGFDTIAVSGISGLVMGGVVAHALGCHLVVVRKEDDHSTHSWMTVEGHIGHRFIFLDDLVESGSTRDYVVSKVRRIARRIEAETHFVGSLLYQSAEAYNGRGEPLSL